MSENIFIFRNSSIEYLFNDRIYSFSELDSIFFEGSYSTYIFFYQCPIDLDYETKINLVKDYKNRLHLILNKIKNDSKFIIFTIEDIMYESITSSDYRLRESINEFNDSIIKIEHDYNNVRVVDFKSFMKKFSINELVDWRYFYMSKSIINPKLKKQFLQWWNNILREIYQKRMKCIVLDLDNTLWGGIVGEDGVHGIKLSDEYPGNAYKHFQRSLKELKEIGVILAICSKNNLSDIKDLWKRNKHMILKEEHFSSIRINWTNKAKNISDISEELNIGLDSILFIDDNPIERELIKQTLEDVVCPDFPEKSYQLFDFIKEIKESYFSVSKLTVEDKFKTENYIANIKRNQNKLSYEDINDYLKSLKINLELISFKKENSTRLAQLTQKTNQFNLTTKRYDEADLFRFIKDSAEIYCINVSDKFGDSGVTGLVIVKKKNKTECYIDSFLMSCRILGRKIENIFIKLILSELKNKGYQKVYSNYIKTSKNKQVENFYLNNNFEEIYSDNFQKKYQIYLKDFDFKLNKNESEIYKTEIK